MKLYCKSFLDRYCIFGDTYAIRQKIGSNGGRYEKDLEVWLMPKDFDLAKCLICFPGITLYDEKNFKWLDKKNTFEFKDQIKAKGGMFDKTQKKWKVPIDFDDSFMSGNSQEPVDDCCEDHAEDMFNGWEE